MIAAINGFVAGPGLHFLLDADLCIAVPEAVFFDMHMHHTGSVPVIEPIEMARKIHRTLKPHFVTQYDEVGAIGRRYRRQDEIGTPFCVTVDFQSLDDQTVTLRDRDSMQQQRVAIADLVHIINDGLAIEY